MVDKRKWAFIIDKDEFVRLSLKKMLKKYGFEVEEVEDISELEKRKKDVKSGMILADLEMEALGNWLPLLKKWNDRFILMGPLVTEEFVQRLKEIGIDRIIKKPVEPRLLRKVIREISFPDGTKFSPPVEKKRENSRSKKKGGEDR